MGEAWTGPGFTADKKHFGDRDWRKLLHQTDLVPSVHSDVVYVSLLRSGVLQRLPSTLHNVPRYSAGQYLLYKFKYILVQITEMEVFENLTQYSLNFRHFLRHFLSSASVVFSSFVFLICRWKFTKIFIICFLCKSM